MTTNRKDAREALAVYLKPQLTLASAVYAYQVADFGNQSPVVYITSSGSSRTKLTGQGFKSVFTLNVHTFVLYPNEKTVGYTERDAEDLLDGLEHQVADALVMLRNHPVIKMLEYGEPSNADNAIQIGGETYLHEIIPVEVTCLG